MAMPEPVTYTYTEPKIGQSIGEGTKTAAPLVTEESVPEIPAHWLWEFKATYTPIAKVLQASFKVLCALALAQPDLRDVWKTSCLNREAWRAANDRLSNRNNIIVVVAGLLLGSYAAFATTVPPVPGLLNYTEKGPYICIVLSFGITLGGLIVGSAIIFFQLSEYDGTYFQNTFMGSPSRILCTLVVLAYPFVAVGAATVIGGIGIVLGTVHSEVNYWSKGTPFLVVAPVLMIPAFVWTQVPVKQQDGEGEAPQSMGSAIYSG